MVVMNEKIHYYFYFQKDLNLKTNIKLTFWGLKSTIWISSLEFFPISNKSSSANLLAITSFTAWLTIAFDNLFNYIMLYKNVE